MKSWATWTLMGALILGAPAAASAQAEPEAAEPGSGAEAAAEDTAPAAPDADSEVADPPDFRIGFWVLDLFAIDREPRGETYRFLDLSVFRLFELGQGPDYRSFSLLEMPDLFNLVTSRREDPTAETRILDLQIIDFALFRQLVEAEDETQTHVLRLPVIGSAYGTVTEPELEKQTYGFLYRSEQER